MNKILFNLKPFVSGLLFLIASFNLLQSTPRINELYSSRLETAFYLLSAIYLIFFALSGWILYLDNWLIECRRRKNK